jgi:hypothetical protein
MMTVKMLVNRLRPAWKEGEFELYTEISLPLHHLACFTTSKHLYYEERSKHGF